MTYQDITLQEMTDYLEMIGFRMYKRDPNTEWIANKIVMFGFRPCVIRVYTSINPNNKSRKVGTDAIRVGVFDGVSPCKWLFGTKRVNRTQGWKANMFQRIDYCEERIKKGNFKIDLVKLSDDDVNNSTYDDKPENY